MIVQIVNATIKPEGREHFLDVIRENAARTRAEDGCLGYQVAEDLESPDTFVLIEHFDSLDTLNAHFQAQFEWVISELGDVFAQPPQASIHEVSSTLSLEEALAGAGIAR